jgi:hypothetical protein
LGMVKFCFTCMVVVPLAPTCSKILTHYMD